MLTAKERDKERLKQERPQKTKKKKNKAARTAQQTLPYEVVLGNNILQVATNKYSKTYKFKDINYQIAKQDDQVDIFMRYGEILNCIDSTIEMQVSIANTHVNKKDFEEKVLIELKNDPYDKYREEYNEMLDEKLEEGQNDLERDKYISLTTEANSFDEARHRFNNMFNELQGNFKRLGSDLKEVTSYERLTFLKNIFRGEETFIPKMSKQDYEKKLDRDYIAPDYFQFENDYFMYNDKYARVVFVRDFPSYLGDKLITELTSLGLEQVLTINIQSVEPGKGLNVVRRQITGMEGDKITAQKKAVKGGYGADIIPHSLKHSLEEAEQLLEDLTKNNQKMFLVNILIMHTADSYKQLNTDTDSLKSITRKFVCNLGKLHLQQEAGMRSALPIGNCTLKLRRTLTTESTAIFMPFCTQEIAQEHGIYYGLNAVSKKLILFNRKSMKNASGFILGTPGCFIGSTKIKLADGSIITLEEMSQKMKDKEIWINSYDIKNNRPVRTQARDPRVTKTSKDLINVVLSNQEVLTCTPDHKFLTKDNRYVKAEDLMPGDKLMPAHEVVSTELVHLEKAVPLYDITVDEYYNFQLECGIYVHNSGKSFSAKREMIDILLRTDDDIIIIDPEREYTPLVTSFGGEVINISASSKNYINPMDMSEDYADEDPIILKSEFILSLCECVVGGTQGLSPKEKAIIDRCVGNIYRPYVQNFDKDKLPTLREFHAELKQQPELEAAELAVALEIYITGSLSVFANKTNINLHNRLTCFDIKDLGKQLTTMGLLIVLDNIWNRITENRALGKNTWIYIDEIYLLFKNEYSANFLFELYKRARKWGGIPTGITQNVEDLLESNLARKMLSNSDFIQMLNQATSDRLELGKILNISDTQLSFVTNSTEGQGLIFCGDSIIPFIDEFPKNTMLYKMMTTKLGEM